MQRAVAIKVSWVSILISIAMVSQAQVILDGRVVDQNNAPVGFVTIGVKGKTYAAMSNEQGYFTVTVPALPQVLVCSAIGYEETTVEVSGGNLIIRLQPRTYAIQDVTIVGNAAYKIFEKAHKRLQKHGYRNYNAKVFYRLVTQNDSVYTELMEGFYDAAIAPTGFTSWKLTHGRYALAGDFKQQQYVVSIDFSGLVRYMDIANDHRSDIRFPLFPFRNSAKADYTFQLRGTTHVNNTEVSKVYFEPKSMKEDAFSGTAFIDEQTGKLHRLEVEYRKPVSRMIKDELGKEIPTDVALTYTIDLKEAPTGEMLLSWVQVDLKYTNTRVVTPRVIHSQIQCFVYDRGTQVLGSGREGKRIWDSDYDAIRSRLYIKPFWEEQAVLAQTSLQRSITESFEKQGSFGQVFNRQTDTNVVVKEGYAVLGSKVNRLLAALPEHALPAIGPHCINLTRNNKSEGSMCSHLFAAYNCYRDSFYVSVLPLLDTSVTWVSDSIKQEGYFTFVFNLYSRLAVVHARKLYKSLRAVPDPCENEDRIQLLVQQANTDLATELYELLTDVWKQEQFRFWDKYVEQAEKEN